MSFFNGLESETNTGEFDSNKMDLIPNDTDLVAIIDDVTWKDYEGVEYINLRWSVVDGEFKNRKLFHKIKVFDGDSGKAEKAKKMLLAINHNAGGNLHTLQAAPTVQDLACLKNKPMIIKALVWEMKGSEGNWICSVSPMGTNQAVQQATHQVNNDNSFDDDIPF